MVGSSSLSGAVVSYTGATGAGLSLLGAASVGLDEVLLKGHSVGLLVQGGGGDPARGVITRSDFADPPAVGILNLGLAHTLLAEDCWWGDASGPVDPVDEPGGLYNPNSAGTGVSGGVDYDPFSTEGAHVVLLGDVNRNAYVTAHDAARLLQYLAGSTTLTAAQLDRADTDCDGSVGAVDAERILRLVSGAIAWFDCTPPPAGTAGPLTAVSATPEAVVLRWSGGSPAAGSVEVRPARPGVRVRSIGWDGDPPGVQTAASVQGGQARLAFAGPERLPGGARLSIQLEVDAGTDPFMKLQGPGNQPSPRPGPGSGILLYRDVEFRVDESELSEGTLALYRGTYEAEHVELEAADAAAHALLHRPEPETSKETDHAAT